ncbi:unnamed protein product [Durusdinium trenchii]|uniref:Uncharacterized protein n=1 Tax=Durusdinium trenchii TaxID=1381693 RepID=A0ABP0J9I2_9DINO
MLCPESCWIWCNSKVDASLEMMRRGWRDSKGREYKLEIQIVPMDDFTMHAMKDPGGYFMIEIDGHRLSHGFDQTHYMHFTARKGHCGMDFFWSHFWPMYKSILGLFQAAREASEPLQVLHVEKSCRLLPAEELKALLCDALMPSPGESGCVPSDHAAVQRVYVWRRRALQAAQRLPSEKMLGGEGHEGDEASTDLLHGNSRREEDLDWAYQGDLQEEANAPYVDRWRTGSVSQQDLGLVSSHWKG